MTLISTNKLHHAGFGPKERSDQKLTGDGFGFPTFERDGMIDFLVIGAMRSGTTSLQECLAQCAAVTVPSIKETDYFVPEISGEKTEAWYKSHFDNKGALRGEINPNYAKRDVFPNVPTRVQQAAPHCKIVYIVRDPIERALSHYQHSKLSGQNVPLPEDLPNSQIGAHILATSRYDWQSQPWRDIFGDQVLVVDFDDIKNNMDKVLGELGMFLEVPLITAHEIERGATGFQEPLKANALENLSAIPSFWLSLRKTHVGHMVRRAIPRNLAVKMKSLLPAKPIPKLEAFPPNVMRWLETELHEDVAALRDWTGQSFKDWQI